MNFPTSTDIIKHLEGFQYIGKEHNEQSQVYAYINPPVIE